LPAEIEAAENLLESLQQKMSASDFYTSGNDTAEVIEAAGRAEAELNALFERWDVLDSLQSGKTSK